MGGFFLTAKYFAKNISRLCIPPRISGDFFLKDVPYRESTIPVIPCGTTGDVKAWSCSNSKVERDIVKGILKTDDAVEAHDDVGTVFVPPGGIPESEVHTGSNEPVETGG